MSIKNIMQDRTSDKGQKHYSQMLNMLDNPKRRCFGSPDTLAKAAGIKPGQKILEIGCGSGYFTAALARETGDTGFVTATDIHPIGVAATKEKLAASGLVNVEVLLDDVLHSELADQSFDLIILYGVVPAPVIPMDELCREMHRLLKPKGHCAIWTMVPLWTPKEAVKSGLFQPIQKTKGVFLLRKAG